MGDERVQAGKEYPCDHCETCHCPTTWAVATIDALKAELAAASERAEKRERLCLAEREDLRAQLAAARAERNEARAELDTWREYERIANTHSTESELPAVTGPCRGCRGSGVMRSGTYPGSGAYVAKTVCCQCNGTGKR